MGGDDGPPRGFDIKQYSYKATSNLVLRQDGRGRRAGAGADDVQALHVGELDGAMGDRCGADGGAAPKKDVAAGGRKRSADGGGDGGGDARRRRVGAGPMRDVVVAAEELGLDAGDVRYVPRMQVSRKAYECLLHFVMTKMGDRPRDVLRDAAEEILTILKDETMREAERKLGAERVLAGRMDDNEFARLSTFGRQIKDFGDDAADGGGTGFAGVDGGVGDGDENMVDEVEQGVAVVFDDEEDVDEMGAGGIPGGGDDIQYLDQVVDAGDASSDGGAGSGGEGRAGNASDGDEGRGGNFDHVAADGPDGRVVDRAPGRGGGAGGAGVDMFAADGDDAGAPTDAAGSSRTVDPHAIDGFWLQRQLSRHYADAQECQAVADKLFAALRAAGADRELENRLVDLLGYDKFELIKLLIKQRAVIVFCVRRARATTDGERAAVEREMGDDVQGARTLAILQGTGQEQGSEAGQQANGAKPVKRRPRRGVVPSVAATAAATAAETAGAGGGGGAHRLRGGLAGGMAVGALNLRKLDLADLSFSQGSHLMSVKECRLPGSTHHTYKDYEEWHVPATRAVEGQGGAAARFVPVASLPTWAQPAFSNTASLNRVQSKVFPCAFQSDENMLLCAPTGAGKTNVAMLAILRAVANAMPGGRDGGGAADLASFKVVYVAPMKALVAEVVANLGKRLEGLGMSVRELTGDVNLTRREIDDTQVIVTTPEKWDIVTRKAGERTFTALVRLLIVDEIHLLHDERGPVLEAIVARTVRSSEATAVGVRIVGLSATLPNYRDVAAFMRVNVETGLFHFDGSFRPCPLQQCFVGITAKKALKRFQLMNELTYDKVKLQVEGGNQVIVFVHSRKDTGLTARHLAEKAIDEEVIDRYMEPGSKSHEVILSEVDGVQSRELAALLENGLAMHHAGMSRGDRTLVEDLFAAGHVKVLVSTATLAWGVNLPAHAVIIRGTQVYSAEQGRWVELSPMDVMQMMGRAGRPQFDSQGEGIIITTKAEVLFYLSVLNQQLPIESQMISRIADVVNAEVAIGSVASLWEGASWLGYTYLYVRMLRNPTLYGISVDEREADESLERRRLELIHASFGLLHEAGLVRYDRRTGQVQGTDLGRVAADFYIGHETMSVYAQHLQPGLNDIGLLRLFTLSGEFKYMRVREEEKLELTGLANRVPIPIKESLDEPSAKVNILLQAYVSNLKLDGLALASDMVYVTQSAGRLARALLQIAIGRRWANLVGQCLNLCKMVSRRQWTSQSPLRQFLPALSDDVLHRIERKDIDFDRYYDLTAAEVGELLRDPKLGKTVHRLVHALPRMELEVTRVQPITRSMLRIEVTLTPDFRFDAKVHGFGESFWVWVEDADSERLLHVEPFYLRGSLAGDEEHFLSFTVPVTSPVPPQYFVRCVSDRWIAPDTVLPVSFRDLILPNKFPPHTELLDLQPLSVRAAFSAADGVEADSAAVFGEALTGLRLVFQRRFKHFNPIQTQSFAALFKSDANVVLAAPSGSGRLVCAELALARLFAKKPTARAVFIAGRGDVVVKRRVEELRRGVGRALGLDHIEELTGESSADLSLLKKFGVIAVATPEKWDMFSRRWQQRKEGRAISSVGLVVLDDAHLIGADAERGFVLEAVGSRMRYISAQPARDGRAPCRIVAILDSVSNARDVGHWLGAPPSCVLTFHPSERPVPLDVHVEPAVFRAGGDVAGTAAALVRPVFRAIGKHAVGASDGVVVFVATRRLARSLALEMVTMAAGRGAAEQFLNASESDLGPALGRVRLGTLRECLAKGVGYVHEALAPDDCAAAEELFCMGAIQVLISTAEYSWRSAAVGGRVVIIAGTAAEEAGGYALARAEYPLAEIAHMVGRAGRRREIDAPSQSRGVCVIVTEPALRDYYRKLTTEALPVESHLDTALADQLNVEVASRVIQTKQQAVDYLTWTLFYRRLPLNPNFYNMAGNTHAFIQDHLSDLVERSLSDLEASKCVAAVGDEDMALGSLNLGMIASHYYIRHSTIELFASSMTPRTKIRGLLDILSSASEYDALPVRVGDDVALKKLAARVPVPLAPPGGGPPPSFSDPHIKAHLLLQSHLSRLPLGGDLADDREFVVGEVVRLLRALVDVISSAGWLKPAIKAMELCQMFVQGMWDSDPSVCQLPHIDSSTARRLKDKYDVETVDQLLEMDDEERLDGLTGLSRVQTSDVARACNNFPEVKEISAQVPAARVPAGGRTTVFVTLERGGDAEADGEDGQAKAAVPLVLCPRYPKRKEEGWWLVVGDLSSNALLSLKYVAFARSARVKLEISAPTAPGEHALELFLISDSYVGDCDQQDEFSIVVLPDQGEEGGGRSDDATAQRSQQ
jgi:pre-mRNA-splicing helicase BRR2